MFNNNANNSSHLKSFEYTLIYASKFINACVLINSGAIVSLMTFIGNHAKVVSTNYTIYGFASFVSGLVFSVALFGVVFIAQQSQTYLLDCIRTNESVSRQAQFRQKFNLWKSVAFCFSAASLLLFVVGAYLTLKGLGISLC